LLAVATLFLPLVVSSAYYFPYIFLKSILFRAAVEAMLVLYALLAAVDPSYRPKFDRLSWALLAWFGAMLVSALPGASVSAWNSWWGDFARMGGMIAQLHLLVFFIVLSHTIRRECDWLALFAASLFFGLLMGLTGLLQELDILFLYPSSNDPRFHGATGNANFFATHTLLAFFTALWFVARKDRSELYPMCARLWLGLLAAVDAIMVVFLWASFERYGADAVPAGKAGAQLAAMAAAVHVLVLGWFFLRRRVGAGIAVLSLAAGFLFFSMYLSQTRGAVIGALAAVLITAAWRAWRASGKPRLALLGMMLLVALSAVLLVRSRDSAWVRSRPALHRLASISSRDPSIEFRLLAWRGSFKALRDRPIFGWGLDNYRNAFDRYFPPGILTRFNTEQWADRAHNLLLDVAIPTGLAGLAAFSAFYALLLAFLLRRRPPAQDFEGRPAFAALVLGYLLQALSTFDTVNTDAALYALLAYASYHYSRPRAEAAAAGAPRRPFRGTPGWKAWAAIAAAAGLGVLAFQASVLRPARANRTLLLATALTKSAGPQSRAAGVAYSPAAVEMFRLAQDPGTTGRYESRQEFGNYVSELLQESSLPPAAKVELVREAVAMLDRSIGEDPRNARHYLYRATLVNRALALLMRHDPALARRLAEQNVALMESAEALSPTRTQVYFEKGVSLRALGRADGSVAAFERSVNLNPQLREPNLELLGAYIEAGRLEEAAAQWRKIKEAGFRLERSDYDRIITLYDGKRQYAAMAELYKEQLAQNPDDVTLLPRLAAVYRSLGEIELARRTAMRAAELSPQIAAELDKFLKSLEEKKR
jgi:O-antigen ligase